MDTNSRCTEEDDQGAGTLPGSSREADSEREQESGKSKVLQRRVWRRGILQKNRI